MSGFFRRLRRPKEEEPEPEEESSLSPDGADELPVEDGPSSPEPPAAPDPGGPPVLGEDRVVTAGAEPPAELPLETPAITPPPPAPIGPPPPLPEPDRSAARSSLTPRRTSSRCFLCGTELDGPWCPTCRIAWND
jgi:hypothetical protein